MKNQKITIICKVILVLIIFITPFRYASKSHKTAQKIDDMRADIIQLTDQIEGKTAILKSTTADIEKMKAEVSFMKSQINKDIQ